MKIKKVNPIIIKNGLYRLLQIPILILVIAACTAESDEERMENLKDEIIKHENDFWKMTKEKGITEAFLHFAAEEAVLSRNNKLVRGKEEIKKYFSNQHLENVSLNWTTFFVDVSESADLAYTYGPYEYITVDEKGDSISIEGYFHTVWKKQVDGSWKYVWD